LFIWDFVADTVLGQIIDWLYGQIVGFLGDFFMQPVRGIEETRRPAGRKKEPSGLFFSVWVPISRNVYRGCCNLQPVRESNSTATDRWQTTVQWTVV